MSTHLLRTSWVWALLLGASLTGPIQAQTTTATLLIQNHRFVPDELRVPAHQRIRLTVRNLDDTPEEFESHSLNREEIIPGQSEASFWIGPLAPGRYEFFGEYSQDTAQGVVVAQ